MKRLIFAVTILAGLVSGSVSGAASLCDDPMGANQVCNDMKNLRGHIMMLESQRDLMQLNYDYVRDVSGSLSDAAIDLMNQLPTDFEDHRPALRYVATQAKVASQLAGAKDPQAFTKSNTLRQSCNGCHTSAEPSSGVRWDEVFKMDWSKIVEKCNLPSRNPFLCKNMYGMVTNYSYVSSAYLSQKSDNKMLGTIAKEISRISGVLVENNFMHDRMSNIQDVRVLAEEVMKLAAQNDPSTLEKANAMVESCMGCHSHGMTPAAVKTTVHIWN